MKLTILYQILFLQHSLDAPEALLTFKILCRVNSTGRCTNRTEASEKSNQSRCQKKFVSCRESGRHRWRKSSSNPHRRASGDGRHAVISYPPGAGVQQVVADVQGSGGRPDEATTRQPAAQVRYCVAKRFLRVPADRPHFSLFPTGRVFRRAVAVRGDGACVYSGAFPTGC
ncbi:hypothetical protein GWI33_016181 [Rhynchophorus ferrugineus]|uniref:Uncharacterized protein n=1 Tax=Rhynchophorus ferrugineus TaxID=354439 RepID=A0A834HZ85_RHYFE|nr:hypothetical protein GWI33_016181 [Rhynchophorus ferrugineus]